MEVKEAADLLDNLIGMVEDSGGRDYDTALRMGIEALTADGDTIYRQAAVERLPSAQPEIIHCKDCKHYNAGFECLIEGYGVERDANWFCGDAERRTDETD